MYVGVGVGVCWVGVIVTVGVTDGVVVCVGVADGQSPKFTTVSGELYSSTVRSSAQTYALSSGSS